MMDGAQFARALIAICGLDDVIGGDEADDKYLRDFLGEKRGRALVVVRPQTTAQVSQLVKLCAKLKRPIVPQGGNTGYRAGCIPDEDGRAVVIAMEKLNTAPRVCAAGGYMTVRAGCILENAQNAAAAAGMFFPLDLGAKGSCQIGGNLATNAGGMNFLRYGGARELCLGVEAVLPSGEIISPPSAARKNNAGYDLKSLLIGSEGTLGIITAANLKLFSPPTRRAAVFAAMRSVEAAAEFGAMCQKYTGGMMESLEVMPRHLFVLLRKHLSQIAQPFSEPPPVAVLAEAAGDSNIAEQLQDATAAAMENKIVQDAVFAFSESQRRAFWAVRESAPEATRREGKWIKLDVCLPPHRIAHFAAAAEKIAGDGAHIIAFGHLGDGNLHLSLRPQNRAPAESPKLCAQIESQIAALAEEEGGSFSAEHGIGKTRTALLQEHKSPAAFAAMRTIKNALDPDGLMNPGAIFAD